MQIHALVSATKSIVIIHHHNIEHACGKTKEKQKPQLAVLLGKFVLFQILNYLREDVGLFYDIF